MHAKVNAHMPFNLFSYFFGSPVEPRAEEFLLLGLGSEKDDPSADEASTYYHLAIKLEEDYL